MSEPRPALWDGAAGKLRSSHAEAMHAGTRPLAVLGRVQSMTSGAKGVGALEASAPMGVWTHRVTMRVVTRGKGGLG